MKNRNTVEAVIKEIRELAEKDCAGVPNLAALACIAEVMDVRQILELIEVRPHFRS